MYRFAVCLILACIAGCSSANREGPDVTCSDLNGGTTNACSEGIIAYCPDGQQVKYKVCTADGDNEAAKKICEEPWQVPNRYRCEQQDQDCFGCTTP